MRPRQADSLKPFSIRLSMRRRRYHSISNIVATVYCERHALLDREHGQARPINVRIKAAAGTFEHKRFELEGKTRAAVDRRCFVATAVYGDDAPQTHYLRSWRDRVLMTRWGGRVLVWAYYRVSPSLVRWFGANPWVTRCVKHLLDAFVARIGGGR